MAGVAAGPVERVWYSSDGATLYARTRSGRILETSSDDSWKPSALTATDIPAPHAAPRLSRTVMPERFATLRPVSGSAHLWYAFGGAVYRSENGGSHWVNLTDFRQQSILGGGFTDLAVSPLSPEQIAVSNRYGVWRSMDGGLSWNSLNAALPNLDARRILTLPQGSQGARLLIGGIGAVEWAPGEKHAWRPVEDAGLAREQALQTALQSVLGREISAVAAAGSYIYAGGLEGRVWTTADGGRNWREFVAEGAGRVEQIYADPDDPRMALVALGARADGRTGARLLRTVNGGMFWDDLSAGLPAMSAWGVAADRVTGTVYLAADGGLFYTFADLDAAGPFDQWRLLSAVLPSARVTDVKLDPAGHQLFVAVEGYGVFAATAPHRFLAPRLVNAADLTGRPAAPGTLLSLLGRKLHAARAGTQDLPVLSASESESQIQVPFHVSGPVLSVALTSIENGLVSHYDLGIALRPASPAIFADRDGTPLLLDGDSGLLLDAMTPARSYARLQVLATGLGRVEPDWPAGLPAPLTSPPRVATPVKAYLDRVPLEVLSATLAPGYAGFYVVEVRLPDIVNHGPAELYLEADGQSSNRVRLYLQP